MKKMLCTALAILLAAGTYAKVVLPEIIADNMVLQQQSEVPLWGTARKNTDLKVQTSWNGKTYTTKTAADGSFRVLVKTPAAGGPYSIQFTDGEQFSIKNVLIGEVWVCSGQSNMEMPVKGFRNMPVLNSADILLDAGNPQVRLFHMERTASKTPVQGFNASWKAADAPAVSEFSAIAYQYACILQKKLGVPVGIIQSCWGGSVIEAWMDAPSLKAFPEIKFAADTAKIDKNHPTVIFNGMINPLLGYGIKGVLWYQGESSRGNAAIYERLMATMVKQWRSLWKRDEWPFYFVQIAPYTYPNNRELVPYLREAQFRALGSIPNSGMVVTMDVGEEHNIHPADKLPVSKRLAYMALAKTYGLKGIPFEGPTYKSMKIDSNTVNVSFDHAAYGLTAYNKEVSGFEIAGQDKKFYPAGARLTPTGIELKSSSVKAPVAVRYGFKDWIVANLYNTEGLPAVPFRTDTW